jgi:transcriptional regulator with XRE-family HTH domain
MQSIGERLEDARKKKGISIREAAEATKIRGEYLQKFEGNQFDIGLADIYTRGFLRGYATYLRLPQDRIVNDYNTLRGGEPRVRQPSREVYGRMDLAISTAEERAEAQADGASPDSAQRAPARFQRPGENLPKGPPINPALVFKGGRLVIGAVVLIAFIWLIKSMFSPTVTAPVPRGAVAAAPETSEAAPSVSVVALEPVRIKVVRKSDGTELFQGALQGGDRRDYPNVPILLTASDLGAVELEYKGRRYPTGRTGHDRIQFDFTGR